MKIIAKTSNGYLLEATTDDIASIQAVSSVDKRFVEPKIGEELKISEIYDRIKEISYIDHHLSELKYANKSLGKIIEQFEILRKFGKDLPELEYQPKRD